MDRDNRQIDRKQNYLFFTQILKGIKHVHAKGIIHRDLKPANIFINGNDLKIGDFNLARALEIEDFNSPYEKRLQRLSSNIGTPLYLAPEQENTNNYNHKVDMYPLGLILLELNYKIGTGHERIKTFKKIREFHQLPEDFARDFPTESEIILQMTSPNPEDRANAEELLESEVMAKWRDEVIS